MGLFTLEKDILDYVIIERQKQLLENVMATIGIDLGTTNSHDHREGG